MAFDTLEQKINFLTLMLEKLTIIKGHQWNHEQAEIESPITYYSNISEPVEFNGPGSDDINKDAERLLKDSSKDTICQ